MTDHPAAPTGAQREKLHSIPYDLVPFAELAEAYARVSEFGAKKYTQYWNTECQGLFNVSNVSKIEISLPGTCADLATFWKNETEQFPSANQGPLVNAPFAAENAPLESWEQVNVAAVTKSASNPPTLIITRGRSKTQGNITEKTKNTGSSKCETEQQIQFFESVISEQSFSLISEIWERQSRNISLTLNGDARSVEPLLTFTLTTTTGQVFSEAFFAHAATTVSGFWATISRALNKHSLIYESDVRVKSTGCWNWSKGLSRVQILGSLLRHTFAYLRGEERDSDSCLLHTDHILWNAVTLVHNVHWGLEDGRRAEPPREYKTKGENVLPRNPVQHSVE